MDQYERRATALVAAARVMTGAGQGQSQASLSHVADLTVALAQRFESFMYDGR